MNILKNENRLMDKNDVIAVSRKQSMKYGTSSLELMRFSLDDYISCRCLYWNGLLGPSFTHASQSIEKLIKSQLVWIGVPIKKSHNLIDLYKKSKLKDLPSGDYDFLKYLGDAYDFGRYPDNTMNVLKKNSNRFQIGWEHLVKLDKLYFDMLETLDVNPYVKYSSGILHILFEKNNLYEKRKYWLEVDNELLTRLYNHHETWWNQISTMENDPMDNGFTIRKFEVFEKLGDIDDQIQELLEKYKATIASGPWPSENQEGLWVVEIKIPN